MNLHGIVSRGIGAVNPNFMVTVKSPTGVVVTTPSGGRLPQRSSSNFFAQVQSLTYQDLVKLDGLNIQGVRRAIYTNGYIASTLRIDKQGGAIIVVPAGTFPEGTIWQCVHVLETWPDWCKIAITLQDQ